MTTIVWLEDMNNISKCLSRMGGSNGVANSILNEIADKYRRKLSPYKFREFGNLILITLEIM